MTWSYGGDPLVNSKDAVRMLVGDTDPTDPLLQDGEINYFLAQYNNAPLNSAIRCCEVILAKFSRMVNEAVGGVRIDFTDRMKNMQSLKNTLILRLATEDAAPYAGGINISDIIQNNQNANRVCPDFTKHMMENQLIAPWVSNQWLWGDQGWNGGCGC
jgi:hypothetical protein